MNNDKKALSVLSAIFAWILSIVLVLVLFVTPVIMSVTSTLAPKNLLETFQDIDLDDFVDLIDLESFEMDEDQMSDILSTDTMKDIYEVYLTDMLSILDSDLSDEGLSKDVLEEIIHDNIDELYSICIDTSPDLRDLPRSEAEDLLEEALVEDFLMFAENFPSSDDVKDMLKEEPETKMVLNFLSTMDTVRLFLILTIVILSVLIFVCRLSDLGGFRWLSTNLFVGAGLSVLVCAGLAMSSALITALVEDISIAEFFADELLSAFLSGVYARTGIMLAAAVVLLVVHIVIKKIRAKKAVPAPVAPTQGA